MSFYSEKCEVNHITTNKTPIVHSYSLHGLAVLLLQFLKSNTVEYISIKTLSGIHTLTLLLQRQIRLGFLKRNLRINSSTVKEEAYKSLVCPNTRILQCSLGPKMCYESQRWRQNKPWASRPTRNGSEEDSKVGDRTVS